MKAKKKAPFEAGQYFNLTGVGMIFGLSALEIAEKLQEYGLREGRKPTQLAFDNGFVKEFNTPEKRPELKHYWQYLKKGEAYWRWSTDRVTLLLVQEGHQMVYRRKRNTYQEYIATILNDGVKTHLLRPVNNVLESYRSNSVKEENHV